MSTREECVCDSCHAVGELEGPPQPRGWLSVTGADGLTVDACSIQCAHKLVDDRFGRLFFVSKQPLGAAR